VAQIPVGVDKIVADYIARVGKVLPVERAILFGSHAKGKADANSDIDIAVISKAFDSMPRVESFVLLMREARPLKADLQPLPFTPIDLEEPLGILEEILSTGVEIAVKPV
jgi:predicted nucleotidyltransferase